MTTEPFIPVCPVEEFPPGSAKTVRIEQREIAVFNSGGTFYALENYCPHQGAALADGWVDAKDATVTCAWHAWCFKLTDGSMTLGSFARVDTYDVKVEDGQVSVASTPRVPEVT